MAADQIIHPIVNRIAGSYYKQLKARTVHRDCEVHQDLYALAQRGDDGPPNQRSCSTAFGSWCECSDLMRATDSLWFRYFIQKAFVEAHAVTPPPTLVGKWITGTVRTLGWLVHLKLRGKYRGPYGTSYYDLFDEQGQSRKDGEPYRKYIVLEGLKLDKTYEGFFDEAVELARVYVRAAYKVYDSLELDDKLRRHFRRVVQNTDLGAPLETGILDAATKALSEWQQGIAPAGGEAVRSL